MYHSFLAFTSSEVIELLEDLVKPHELLGKLLEIFFGLFCDILTIVLDFIKATFVLLLTLWILYKAFLQCWTKGRSSTAVAEDLGPTATATVAEV